MLGPRSVAPPFPEEPVALTDIRLGGFRGTRVGEASHPGPCIVGVGRLDCLLQLFASLAAIRVGESGVPGPRRLSSAPVEITTLTLNTGGKQGAWRLLNHFAEDSASCPDVLFLQEVAFTAEDAKAYAKSWRTQGFVLYWVPTPVGGSTKGGVAILVSESLRCVRHASVCGHGGQAFFVSLNGMLRASVYVAHHVDRDEFLRDVLDQVLAVDWQPWFVAGDFNLTPQENWLVDVLVASGAVCSLPSGLSSTRWEGRRVLDYAVTNLPGVSSSLLEAKFSDHKGLLFALGVAQVDRARTVEAVPCNVFLAKDPCQAVAWHNLVRHAWSQFPFSRYCAAELCGQGLEVDVIWQIFEQHCESVLSHAANLAASSGIVLVRVRRSCRPKGSAVVFRTRTPHHRQPYLDCTSNRIRKMRKFVARLHELELRVALADPSPQVASLRVKVQRSPCWFDGATAVSASRELDRLELQANRDRIHAWKARLQSSDKALYRWLKGHAEPVSHNLLDDEACGPPVVSLDPVGALGCLSSFWRRVWDRPSDLEADFEQYLATYGDGAWATQPWPSLSAAQFEACCYASGSSVWWPGRGGLVTNSCCFLMSSGKLLLCLLSILKVSVAFLRLGVWSSRPTFLSLVPLRRRTSLCLLCDLSVSFPFGGVLLPRRVFGLLKFPTGSSVFFLSSWLVVVKVLTSWVPFARLWRMRKIIGILVVLTSLRLLTTFGPPRLPWP